MTLAEAAPRRIRKRAIWIGAVSVAVAFLGFSWRAGVSLTIAAAVVIFSFLVFERLTERLVLKQESGSIRVWLPPLLVTVASIALFGVLLLYWKGFEPLAGAVGLSCVVLAIVLEVWEKRT